MNEAQSIKVEAQFAAGIEAESPKRVGLRADGLVADSPFAAQRIISILITLYSILNYKHNH